MTSPTQAVSKVVFALVALSMLTMFGAVPARADKIEYVINNSVPITSSDIARRQKFLALQRKKSSHDAAAQEMIDQTLQNIESEKQGVRISNAEADAAYKNFASNNGATTAQIDQMLAQSGVTKAHFIEFLRSTLTWNKTMQKRYGSALGGESLEQKAVQWMLSNGGEKPKSTEYLLQQVIFVVPARDRNRILGKRKAEAEQMRKQYNGCDSAHDLAKKYLDVTPRALGRYIEENLPPDWKKQIMNTPVGKATPTRVTERGVEFVGVCSTRIVSDDKVAEIVYQQEHAKDMQPDVTKMSDDYIAELRKKAMIVKR